MDKLYLKDIFLKPLSGEWGKEVKNDEKGHPVIRTTNFTNSGEIDYDNLAYRDIDILKKKNKLLKNGDIIIEKSGGTPKTPVGRVVYFDINNENYFTNNFTAILRTKGDFNSKYIFYMMYYFHKIGVVLKYQNKTTGIINLKLNDYLKNTKVKIPQIDIQNSTVYKLDKLKNIIQTRQDQIQALDDLIKSTFFQFINEYEIKNILLDHIFEFIDGDRGKNYPKRDDLLKEGYCLFLNAKNVTLNGFKFDDLEFISKERDELLRKGKLKRGDIILTTRGTVGNIAYYDYSVDFENIRINSGMVILRKKININPIYFQEIIRNTHVLNSGMSGSAQPQLPIRNLKNIKVPIIDIEKQNQFAAFVEKIEKQKQILNASLEDLTNLFDSLMQDAFDGSMTM